VGGKSPIKILLIFILLEKPSLQSKFTLLKYKYEIQKKNWREKIYFAKELGPFLLSINDLNRTDPQLMQLCTCYFWIWHFLYNLRFQKVA
jgi:hypothetical protein